MEPAKRKVISRSPSHTVRLIHLPHVQPDEPVEADSSLERDFIHIAAIYPLIHRITDQPFRLNLGESRYTPDFLLQFQDGTKLVVEVKPEGRVAEYEQLFEKAKQKLNESGYEFMVAMDTDIKHDDIEERALLIRRYCKTTFDKDIRARAIQVVGEHIYGIELGILINQYQIPYEVLMHLIGTHQLCTDSLLSISNSAILKSIQQFKEEIENEHQTYAIHFRSWINNQNRHELD